MNGALEMSHLRMDLQRVQIRKALAAIFAGMAEVALMHALYVRVKRALIGQQFAALRTSLRPAMSQSISRMNFSSVARQVVLVLNCSTLVRTKTRYRYQYSTIPLQIYCTIRKADKDKRILKKL
jgi:hypothetical protein